jgi:predicted ATPase/class 3 adenylate cyclase
MDHAARSRAVSVPPPEASGTVTFLFTDIEGSTQRWERFRQPMSAALARHDAILDAAIAAHDGVTFKKMGDAYCAAFQTPSSAMCAALDAQRALQREDFSSVDGLRVRMAIHSGEAEHRDRDYFGPSVNRVARLLATGHGGQVLLSGSAAADARHALPAGATLLDLGSHRLKDLSQPEHVWQLVVGGLAGEFPALKSLMVTPNNLPVAPSSFRGREGDVAEIKTMLEGHRLVTVLGTGGVGKTRLALHVGAHLIEQFPDGVWFADLAPISDEDTVAAVIARALGMGRSDGAKVEDAFAHWLKRRKLLLILDNCEHVVAAAAGIANAIVQACPDVRLLATSREPLHVGGEAVYRLPSLAVPERAESLTANDALEYGAIALFVDRARAADRRFAITDENASIIADICRRLDGIPLAIELAAARVKVLSIASLARHLDDRFRILTGGSRTALPRQQTLAALIGWSYDLLSEPERMLFHRVAVFAGGCNLESASAVCTSDGLDAADILDLLASLVDKSLIVADTSGPHERFRMLETTRAYALAKLEAAGERARWLRKHAEYFRDLADKADADVAGSSTLAWLAEQELEIDNYRAALEWALIQENDVVLGADIAGALRVLWTNGGLAIEGAFWMKPALEKIDREKHPRIAARLLDALASLRPGKHMIDYAQQALRLYEQVGDRHGVARALRRLASGCIITGRFEEALEASRKALLGFQAVGDQRGIGECIREQGIIALQRGEIAQARDLLKQALAIFQSAGAEFSAAGILMQLSELEFADGHPDRALQSLSQTNAIDAHRVAGPLHTMQRNINGAAYRLALGDIDGARAAALDGFKAARQVQNPLLAANALQHYASCLAATGEEERAARLMGFADAVYHRMGAARDTTEKWGYEQVASALREKLGEARLKAFAEEGAAWTEDRAAAEAT